MKFTDLPEEQHEEYAMSLVAGNAAEEILYGSGYVLLEDHFDPSPVLEVVRDHVDAHLERGGGMTSGGYRPGNVAGDPLVQDLMLDPLLLEVGRLCIGSRPAYGSLGANCVPPRSAGMDPHIDYPYFAMGSGLPGSSFPSMCVQLIWYLVDVDEDFGPTLVLPGTQVRPSRPVPGFARMAERVTAKAGTVFVGHGAIWHGVAPNRKDELRHALLGSYVPFWVQPMLVPAYSFSRSFRFDELLRSDMGRRIGEGYSATIASSRLQDAVPDEEEETGPGA